MEYDRQKAVAYAQKYAFNPNPDYYFFDEIGGDCTNFVSQCLHAGGFKMIYNLLSGWFYANLNYRSPSWSGVKPFREFLLFGGSYPNGEIVDISQIEEGDVVFLNDGNRFYHTLLVTKIEGGQIYTSSHSFASFNRNLNTYYAQKKEFVHINSKLN